VSSADSCVGATEDEDVSHLAWRGPRKWCLVEVVHCKEMKENGDELMGSTCKETENIKHLKCRNGLPYQEVNRGTINQNLRLMVEVEMVG